MVHHENKNTTKILKIKRTLVFFLWIYQQHWSADADFVYYHVEARGKIKLKRHKIESEILN